MKSYIESKDPNRLMSYVSNSLWQTPKDATALGDMIMANDIWALGMETKILE